LGWIKEKDRLISDMGITIGSSLSRHRDEKSSTIRYIGFNANAGYDVLKDERITLYPLAGIGFQAYQAIFYKDNSAVDFDDVLQSPAVENSIHPVKFHNGFWVYRAGLGLSFTSPKHPSGSIGLQAGYTGSFQKRAWRSSDNQSLRNAPKDRISQFYISLILTSKPWMMKR
jgi:opacity protein-like surface antigen